MDEVLSIADVNISILLMEMLVFWCHLVTGSTVVVILYFSSP